MNEKTENDVVFGADVKRLPLKDLVKRIGPGLIATGIVIGPGAVTTASMLGADYGYDLVWLFLPIMFMGITFMLTTNRLAIVSGLPTIHAIRKYYGPVASGVVEGYKKPTALRICMTISYVFALIMTISALSSQLPKLMKLFGG